MINYRGLCAVRASLTVLVITS